MISSTQPAPAVAGGDELGLLRAVARRDRRAFEVLYRAYYPRLFRYLLRLTRRAELVEEIVDDVMMVVWEKADSFGERSRVSTWILGIAYHKALKALDRRPPFLQLEEGVADRQPAGRLPGDLTPKELRLTVASALGLLTSQHRAVVELTYYYGYSYREIGEIVGCPVNTVKTRMFHARRRLRQALVQLEGRPVAVPREEREAEEGPEEEA